MRARILGVCAVAFVAAMAIAPLKAAAQTSDAIKDTVGAWEISNADRDKTCMVTFKADTTPGGYKLEFDKAACAAAFPPLNDVVAWNLVRDDTVRLIDGKGKTVFEFNEVESGMYESLRPGQPLIFMQNAAAAAATAITHSTDELAGDWKVVRSSGATICRMTLSTTIAGKEDFALKLQPGCDATITRFAPSSWQIDHGELVLKSSKGQTWRFEETDPSTWQRIPEGPDPLLLMRP